MFVSAVYAISGWSGQPMELTCTALMTRTVLLQGVYQAKLAALLESVSKGLETAEVLALRFSSAPIIPRPDGLLPWHMLVVLCDCHG